MKTIMGYTTIEQSKKLAEILPLESADMTYFACVKDWRGNPVEPKWGKPTTLKKKELALPCSNFQQYAYLSCWSLASLLGVLPYYPTLHRTISGWRCDIYNEKGHISQFGEKADNPVDACYEMILKLNEQKKL